MTATAIKRRVALAHADANRNHAWFNCWGATLYILGGHRRRVWFEVQEMQHWLDMNTEQIHGPRKVGDIVCVHTYELQHTAVYLGKGKYFHKMGSNRAEVTDLAGIRNEYSGRYTWRRVKEQLLTPKL